MLAFGPHATTPASVHVPFVQTFSVCQELLHGPPQRADGSEQGVPAATGLLQFGNTVPPASAWGIGVPASGVVMGAGGLHDEMLMLHVWSTQLADCVWKLPHRGPKPHGGPS